MGAIWCQGCWGLWVPKGKSMVVPLGHAKTPMAVPSKVQKDSDRGCNIVVPTPCFPAEARDVVGRENVPYLIEALSSFRRKLEDL